MILSYTFMIVEINIFNIWIHHSDSFRVKYCLNITGSIESNARNVSTNTELSEI